MTNLESFLDLNASLLDEISSFQLGFLELNIRREPDPKFHISNYDILDNVSRLFELYVNEVGYYPENDLIEQKISEFLLSSSMLSDQLDMAVRMDYSLQQPDKQSFTIIKLIKGLEELYSIGKPKINSVNDIDTIEELIRFMHSNLNRPKLVNVEIEDNFLFDREYKFSNPLSKYSASHVTILDNNDCVYYNGGILTSSDDLLKPFLKHFTKKSRIRANIKVSADEINGLFPIAQHTSQIVVNRQDEEYDIKYWGSGDYAYGTRRQEYTRDMLDFFGFRTTSCDVRGVKSNNKTTDKNELNLWIRSILFFLENSKDLDISGMGMEPQAFAKHTQGLIKLEDYQEQLNLGIFNVNRLYESEEYFRRIDLLSRDHNRYRKILGIACISPFPVCEYEVAFSKQIQKKEYGDFDNIFGPGRYNPDVLGFLYYHLPEFYPKQISREELFRLILDVDYVFSTCYQYKAYDREINDYKIVDVEPFNFYSRYVIKNLLESVWDNIAITPQVETSKARLVLGNARWKFADTIESASFKWEYIKR